MPNIWVKSGLKKEDVEAFLTSVARQIKEQNGVIMDWVVSEERGMTHIHYAWKNPDIQAIIEGQKQIDKLPIKIIAGDRGVQLLTNGDIKHALRVDMKGRGYGKIKFEGVFG
jgi:hypothetical protein